MVKYLLASNSNINAQTLDQQSTPLHIAIQALEYGEETRIVYKLVSYKCKTEIEDAAKKKPADYIVEIEDEDLQ